MRSAPPFRPAGSATIEDLGHLDIRGGRILAAAPLEGAPPGDRVA